jgi:hypothetical protein
MKQTGLFDAIAREDDEQKRREYKEKFGWSKERAQGYNPGHPWCDPDAYPVVDDLLHAEPGLPPGVTAETYDLFDWPRAQTVKAAQRRAEKYGEALAQRAKAALAYEDMRLRDPETIQIHSWELSSCDGDKQQYRRGALASYYNQLLYYRLQVFVAVRRWPELKLMFPDSGIR